MGATNVITLEEYDLVGHYAMHVDRNQLSLRAVFLRLQDFGCRAVKMKSEILSKTILKLSTPCIFTFKFTFYYVN